MLEIVKVALAKFTFLSPKDLIQIASISKIRMVKRNEQLLRAGEMNHDVNYVISGLFRQYVINEDGLESTLRFVPEKNQTGSMDTIFLNQPASENIEALENSVIFKLDIREFEKLAAESHRITKLQNVTLKELVVSNVKYIKYLNTLSPEERFTSFNVQHPELVNRVKQKHLASYLGVTETSLSRLKARVS